MKTTYLYKKIFGLVVLAGLLLAACTPAVPTETAAPGAEQPVSTNTPAAQATVETPSAQPAAALAAQKDLARRLNLSVDAVKITSVEEVQWPNGCMGLEKPGEMCTMVIIEGYRVMLEAGGKTYEYHTNLDGRTLRLADKPGLSTTPGSEPSTGIVLPAGDQPEAVLKAREVLAQQLQVSPEAINIVSVEEVEWPNGCLGVEQPGRMCTQAITPGYRVTLEYQGKEYEFHTDITGAAVKNAMAPLPKTMEKSITWEQTENNVCSRAEIGAVMAAFGVCNGKLTDVPTQPARREELRTLLGTYASFKAVTPAGTVSLNGRGTKQASEAEQRSIAEWARLVRMEAESGRSGAAWGLALGWHRQGGIAGFCDDLGVYLSGWAQPTSCKGNNPASLPAFRLTADQLVKLYSWVDQYQNFEYEVKDPANASDAMTVRLTFSGQGKEQAPAAVQAEITKFAAEVFIQAPK